MGHGLTYISIDIEASGPVPGLFNLVSIGAVAVEKNSDGVWAVDDGEFYVEVKPIFDGFDPEAERIHGLSKAYLEEKGSDPIEAMQGLEKWTKEKAGKRRALFVGHNAPFDWMYIAYYFAHAKMANPYGYNGLDTKALAMGKLDLEWLETNKERLAQLLPGLPDIDTSQIHNAVYDARYQAHILCALINRPKRKV